MEDLGKERNQESVCLYVFIRTCVVDVLAEFISRFHRYRAFSLA